MLFSQDTFFQDCDDEPQAENNQAVQLNIWKCVAALEILTLEFFIIIIIIIIIIIAFIIIIIIIMIIIMILEFITSALQT